MVEQIIKSWRYHECRTFSINRNWSRKDSTQLTPNMSRNRDVSLRRKERYMYCLCRPPEVAVPVTWKGDREIKSTLTFFRDDVSTPSTRTLYSTLVIPISISRPKSFVNIFIFHSVIEKSFVPKMDSVLPFYSRSELSHLHDVPCHLSQLFDETIQGCTTRLVH